MEAGRLLASKLREYEGVPDVVVLGLPRGGVPIAFEIAQRLHAPLDVLVVRKLGVPWQPELAMGAVASGGARILNHELVRSLNLSNYFVYGVIAREEVELARREALFRDGYPAQALSDRTVILVDDGAATGSTMLAATEAVRKQRPKDIVIAIPVASRDAYRVFEAEVGKSVCLAIPQPFYSVGQWYESFPQVPDKEVQEFLSRARSHQGEEESLVQPSIAG
jgi:putative phosphoribosyl transferase